MVSQFDGNSEWVYDDMYDDEYLWNEHLYSEFDRPKQTLFELYTYCLIPVITDGLRIVLKILAYCFLLKFVTYFNKIPRWFKHSMSFGLGISYIYQDFGNISFFIIFLALSSFILLFFLRNSSYGSLILSLFSILYLIICELFIVDATNWHKIRGIQMILAMKIISISIDLKASPNQGFPDIHEYLGYTLCIGTLVFGPWVSYNDYKKQLNQLTWSFKWILNVLLAVLACFLFLIISTCFSSWIIEDNNYQWIVVYRDALSFRTSHYFITFLSQATLLAVGLDTKYNFVSNPLKIEFPRSLVEVVVNWHIPMHVWLKNYVFKICKPYGTLLAVLMTYATSSVLHGLNFQLAAVLLSLGFFSYSEHVLRLKVGKALSACILARSCHKECNHRMKWNHPFTLIVNILLGLFAVFNLAYLGVMFDTSSQLADQGYGMFHTLSKWKELNFICHWIQIFIFSIAFLL